MNGRVPISIQDFLYHPSFILLHAKLIILRNLQVLGHSNTICKRSSQHLRYTWMRGHCAKDFKQLEQLYERFGLIRSPQFIYLKSIVLNHCSLVLSKYVCVRRNERTKRISLLFTRAFESALAAGLIRVIQIMVKPFYQSLHQNIISTFLFFS